MDHEHYEEVYINRANDDERQSQHSGMFLVQTLPTEGSVMVQEDHILGITPGLLRALLLGQDPKEQGYSNRL